MGKWETEPSHVLHVAFLSLRLFDDLSDIHKLDPEARLLLEVAAWLHDIGWATALDGKEHHKVSARMIREHPWESLIPSEVDLVAQVARYHRKSVPSMDHKPFLSLRSSDQVKVQWLSAFLRVGDGLDRRHVGIVKNLKATVAPQHVHIQIEAMVPAEVELMGAHKKCDLLVDLLKLPLLWSHPVHGRWIAPA